MPNLEDAPRFDEFEVSVFGPGVGESIVVHLGDGEWMIVDSFRDRKARRAVALCYLERIGVDPRTQVRSVVATHWDSDHIRGLGEIVACCENADFWCSGAIRSVEFDTLLDLAATHQPAMGSKLREIASVVAARRRRLGDRLGTPRFATDNSLLIERPASGALPRRAVYGLSPSDSAQLCVQQAARAALSGNHLDIGRVRELNCNDTSVVLLVVAGEHGALLGADLETSTDPSRGWLAAVRRANELGVTASLVKVPHHGAPNGHECEMWSSTLSARPAAAVTPFFGGVTHRPQPADRQRIRDYTEHAYLTTEKPTEIGEQSILPLVLPGTSKLRSIEGDIGHVRWRRSLDWSGRWRVDLDEPACQL